MGRIRPTLNPQVTDQLTSTNATAVGEAPAMAMGSLYQTISNSVAMAAANAVYARQQANVTHQIATTVAVTKIDHDFRIVDQRFHDHQKSNAGRMLA